MSTPIVFDEDSRCSISNIESDLNISEPDTQNNIQVLEDACASTAYLDGKFFSPNFSESSSSGSISGKCQLCPQAKFIKGAIKSASNFISHLKRAHANAYENEYKPYVQEKRLKLEGNSSSCALRKVHRLSRQKKFEENAMTYILDSMSPLSTVELPSFRKMIDDLSPKEDSVHVKHLSRRALGRVIKTGYNDSMHDIRAIFKDVNYVCTTADVWSSSTRRFMGVTAHWIDSKSFELKSAACRFAGTHSYDRIAEILQQIHTSFGLDSKKLVATVTDNGTNFVKAFSEFGITIPLSTHEENADGYVSSDDDEDDDISSSDDEPSSQLEVETEPALPDNEFRPKPSLSLHLRCAAHTINLIASTDFTNFINQSSTLLSQHTTTMDRCQALWRLLRSTKKRELMIEYLGKALQRPICVRWNSLFDSLQLMLSLREEITEFSGVIKIKKPLQESDFEYLEEYLSCMRPLIDTLNKLQGEKYCSYGYLLPCIVSLRRKLYAVKSGSKLNSCNLASEYLVQRVEHRFKDLLEVEGCGKWAATAAVIHPQFKSQWISCLPTAAQKKVYSAVMAAATEAQDVHLLAKSTECILDDFFDFGSVPSNINTQTFGNN